MPSLDLIAAFVSAARHAGFAAAARELGLSPSAVAKNVARLETELGVRLFHRTTREISLTPDGEELLERCARIIEDIDALDAAAADTRAGVRGTLRLDAPIAYGHAVILPAVATLLRRHPALKVDLRFGDAWVDLVKEGLDAAVRIGPLADTRLVARRIDEQRLLICAAPSYLDAHGVPATPAALAAHRCLLYRLPTTGRDRPWQLERGRQTASFLPAGDLRLGDGESLTQFAIAGFGLVQVPHYYVEAALAAGTLIEVLQGWRPPPTPISLVYPSQRQVPPRVRAFIEVLTELTGRSVG